MGGNMGGNVGFSGGLGASGGVPQVDSIGTGARASLRRPMSAMDHTRSSGTPISHPIAFTQPVR